MLLFSYQRLVGAGRVRRRRHKSKEWRRDDTARRAAVMRSGWAPPLPSAAPPPTTVACTPDWPRPAPSQAARPPAHGNPPKTKRRSAAERAAAWAAASPTAGAATVLARRSSTAAAHVRVVSCPGDTAHNEVMRLPLARATHLPTHVEQPRQQRRNQAQMYAARARGVKRRRHDGQLRTDGEIAKRLRGSWLGDG